MRRILSYYKKENNKIVEEYLLDHIRDCISLLNKLNRSSIGMMGISLNKNFLDMVRLSVVFHDLGKTFYCKRGDFISFTGHEIFSAYIFHAFEKEFIKNKLYEIENTSMFLKPILFAVSFHHHPMGIKKRMEQIRLMKILPASLDELLYELSFMDSSILSVEEKNLLNITIENIRCKVKNGLKTIDIIEQLNNSLRDIFDRFISGKKEDIAFKNLSYITLVVLISVDYISAKKSRGGGTIFGNVMEEFYKLYLDPYKLYEN